MQARAIHNVLARTIGRHGLRAPEKVWEDMLSKPHRNPLFTAQYDKKTRSVCFVTDPIKTPQMILAEQFLENGVNLTIPLVATHDGRLELDTRKGNLPTRWPLMLYDFVFSNDNGYSRDTDIISYTDPSFNDKCMSVGQAMYVDNKHVDDMNKESYVQINEHLYRPDRSINMHDFIRFYKHGLGSFSLHINRGPYVTDQFISQTHPNILKRRCLTNNVYDDSNRYYWSSSDTYASLSTKMFTDQCVARSNDFQKYHCDIGCSQGSFGFPKSSYLIAMHILFGKGGSMYFGEYDMSNNYFVRDAYQFEEIVVLHKNIEKSGGESVLRDNFELQRNTSMIPSEIQVVADKICARAEIQRFTQE
jgi:hypothetical protein